MQLGFVSAILPDLSLDDVLAFAADAGYACVELMCWPPGTAERRYAGVTHLDVTNFTDNDAAHVQSLVRRHGVQISGLGYYPNPLDPDEAHRRFVVEHLHKVIVAANKLGLNVVNTFIGRNPALSIDDNWPLLMQVWPAIVHFAERHRVRIGIEHCPMLFSRDEWPGGKNLAVAPAIWRRLFEAIPSDHLGLNLDPSHLIWQNIDAQRCVRDFAARLVHVHAKDERIDRERLHDVGIMGLGWHIPKLPGLGDVQWGPFFAALGEAGYRGPVCVEVEDRAYEGTLDDRKRALRQSQHFLAQFLGG